MTTKRFYDTNALSYFYGKNIAIEHEPHAPKRDSSYEDYTSLLAVQELVNSWYRRKDSDRKYTFTLEDVLDYLTTSYIMIEDVEKTKAKVKPIYLRLIKDCIRLNLVCNGPSKVRIQSADVLLLSQAMAIGAKEFITFDEGIYNVTTKHEEELFGYLQKDDRVPVVWLKTPLKQQVDDQIDRLQKSWKCFTSFVTCLKRNWL
ncbi:MAG: hypothetical protein WC263_02535 [Candidatus Micrarchaeia archaeon]|jgi:hypothetical protein